MVVKIEMVRVELECKRWREQKQRKRGKKR